MSKSRTGRDLVACGALTDSSLSSSSPATTGVRIHPLPCPSPSLGCGSCLQHGSPLLIGVWTPSPVSSLRATVVLRKIVCPEHSDVLVFQWFLWALRLLLPPPLTFFFFSIVCLCVYTHGHTYHGTPAEFRGQRVGSVLSFCHWVLGLKLRPEAS